MNLGDIDLSIDIGAVVIAVVALLPFSLRQYLQLFAPTSLTVEPADIHPGSETEPEFRGRGPLFIARLRNRTDYVQRVRSIAIVVPGAGATNVTRAWLGDQKQTPWVIEAHDARSFSFSLQDPPPTNAALIVVMDTPRPRMLTRRLRVGGATRRPA